MKKNVVKEKLAGGKPSIGAWLSLVSSVSAEYMAHIGFDWLVVDTEHSPFGFETTLQCFQAICTTDTIPMARVAWNDPMLIKRLLDAGAMGLVVPMVNSPEEAEKAVTAMKYPPEGIRSLGGGRAATVYGDDYFEKANDETVVIVQIEHIDAVKRVKEIVAVKGIDSCYIGPRDLAASMGVEAGHPDHEEAIAKVLKAAQDAGTPAGIHTANVESVNKRVEQGFQFIALGSDMIFLRSEAKNAHSQLKIK